MKPISIQLYTVRELTKDGNHLKVLQEIADIGYKGVEGFGYGMSPTEWRKTVEDMGMVTSSYFGGVPTPETVNEFIETAQALGVTDTVSGFWIPDFESVDAIKRTAEKVNEVLPKIRAAGLHFSLHNHWFEFEMVEGKHAIDHLLEYAPDVELEVDIYWASAFGANVAAEMVAKHASRARLLHVKDGPLVKGEPMTAVGQGKVDVAAALRAEDPNVTQWHIVELDECATDMMTAVRESYEFLIREGLALGNR